MELNWAKHSCDSSFVKKMRRELRMFRRERGRAGHEFVYDDLRAVWVAENDYVILTHNTDRLWQLWWRDAEDGWFLQSWHRLLAEAKEEAEKPRVPKLSTKTLTSGLYVCAQLDSGKPIMVRCSSQYTASEIADVFGSLGYQTSLKTVV